MFAKARSKAESRKMIEIPKWVKRAAPRGADGGSRVHEAAVRAVRGGAETAAAAWARRLIVEPRP